MPPAIEMYIYTYIENEVEVTIFTIIYYKVLKVATISHDTCIHMHM